ncbi:ubiquinone biosynthesis protein UbiH [Acetobacteraceae bacterium]|nr:ubiquinone biosynthesis protein UbiH [Acetobacteraceae bacterium]
MVQNFTASEPTTHFDICINGAGPIGAVLGISLAQKGLKVLMLERRKLPLNRILAQDGRAYALNARIRPLLEKTKIWENFSNLPQAINIIHVKDCFKPAFSWLKNMEGFSFLPSDLPKKEPFGWMVEAADLLPAITHALKTCPNLTVLSPYTAKFDFKTSQEKVYISAQKEDAVEIENFTAALVIAADGRKSQLREQVGIDLTIIPYHKDALVTLIAHEHAHQGSALENFLPEGPFARLPLQGMENHPHCSAIVWTDTPEWIARLKSLPEKSFLNLLRPKLEKELGEISNIGPRWTYPLCSQYAHKYIASRLALIGDSAHGLHPVAGQGMNLGFRDVSVLKKILTEAFSRGEDLGSDKILKTYQRKTRPYNMALLASCDLMERSFSSSNPILRAGRQATLGLFKKIPALRKMIAKQSLGKGEG